MIYVYAVDRTAAETFVLDARLFGEQIQMITDAPALGSPFEAELEVARYAEEDEVYVLEGAAPMVARQARVAFDKAFPKPFYRTNFKIREVESVPA